jgi:hypothetical protein
MNAHPIDVLGATADRLVREKTPPPSSEPIAVPDASANATAVPIASS